MHHLLYFIAAVILVIGLLYLGGYIGDSNSSPAIGTTESMNKLIGGSGSDSSGGCASCKWY